MGGGGCLITSQTLESVFKEQEAVFQVHVIGGGRRVAELGVGFVALRRADPGEPDFGGVADDDVVTGSHVQRSQAVDEELCEAATRNTRREIRSESKRSPLVSHPTHPGGPPLPVGGQSRPAGLCPCGPGRS